MDNLALAINPSFLLLKEWIVTAGLSSVAYQLRIKSPKTGWPECSGTVAGLHWNRWPESAGISGRNGAENAVAPLPPTPEFRQYLFHREPSRHHHRSHIGLQTAPAIFKWIVRSLYPPGI